MYSLISLFLTCCGLFGMALYATEQRTKEIGIRKVNGATSPQIMLLLNSQFISWIGISFIIAIPITWLLLNRWLENFVYHTDMNIGIYLISGFLSCSSPYSPSAGTATKLHPVILLKY